MEIELNNSNKQMRDSDVSKKPNKLITNILSSVFWLFLLSFFFGPSLWSTLEITYWELVELDEDSSVGEYFAASDKLKIRFNRNICAGVPCIEKVDFFCGFSVGRSETLFEEIQDATLDCFYSELRTAHTLFPIGGIVLYCGKQFAYFSPAPSDMVTPENCARNGGTWGEISP
jgi:hypothetical protein